MLVQKGSIHSGPLPTSTMELLLEDLCDAALDRNLTRHHVAVRALQNQQLVNASGFPWTSRDAIAARCGISADAVGIIIEELRCRDESILRRRAQSRLKLSAVGDCKEVTIEHLRQIVRSEDLRMRAFGEENLLSHLFDGDRESAADALRGMFATGWLALYRDELGLFLGPPNPKLIDHDPFAGNDDEEALGQ